MNKNNPRTQQTCDEFAPEDGLLDVKNNFSKHYLRFSILAIYLCKYNVNKTIYNETSASYKVVWNRCCHIYFSQKLLERKKIHNKRFNKIFLLTT